VNCWTTAEHAGEAGPDGMENLLCRAAWYAEALSGDRRSYVVDHDGDRGTVLVVDETGDLEKSTHTVGVHRQYAGTAGGGSRTPRSGAPGLCHQTRACDRDDRPRAGCRYPGGRGGRDEFYGNDPKLRADQHERRLGYHLAVARDHQIMTGIDARPGDRPHQAAAVVPHHRSAPM
jgi:hypothetical protein